MQQSSHPQNGDEQKQRQPQAYEQARQIASQDIGPGRERSRHQEFVGAPVHISRHPISRNKGQQQGQDDQIGGQSPQQSSCTGPSNVGAELYAARDRTSLI